MPLFEVVASVLVLARDENEAALRVETALDRVGDPAVEVRREINGESPKS